MLFDPSSIHSNSGTVSSSYLEKVFLLILLVPFLVASTQIKDLVFLVIAGFQKLDPSRF